ncbi:MAG: hypothetical protein WAQ25_00015 [Candidatus Saccharimonas sp.]|jgi:hypothetical protein
MRLNVWYWFGPRRFEMLRTATLLLAFLALNAFASPVMVGTQRTAGSVPKPVIESARGGQCVESANFMRRNHMDLLMHQRDDTMRSGVRKTRHSLKECIACHASQNTNSVAASSTNFCQSCHAYAAVKIDCFECHASQPQVKR